MNKCRLTMKHLDMTEPHLIQVTPIINQFSINDNRFTGIRFSINFKNKP